MGSKQTPDEQEFIQTLLSGLPPMVAREKVEELTGGLVSARTLYLHDKSGKGPEVAWRFGRKVSYQRESLVAWMVESFGVKRIANLKTL